MKALTLLAAVVLAGCVANPPVATAPPADPGRAEVESLKARLAVEISERERLLRAAARREDALRKQLEAMKAIERGILEREDRVRYESR